MAVCDLLRNINLSMRNKRSMSIIHFTKRDNIASTLKRESNLKAPGRPKWSTKFETESAVIEDVREQPPLLAIVIQVGSWKYKW